jgi:NDP-sugar pyrophosphorylase family protein
MYAQAKADAEKAGKPAPDEVEFDFAQNVFSGLLKRMEQDPSLGIFWAQQMECYWSDIGNPRQYISSVRDIYAGKLRVAMPENLERYYRDGVIYWDGAQEIADQENAKLKGNVVVAKRFQNLG